MQNQAFVLCLVFFIPYSFFMAIDFVINSEQDYFIIVDGNDSMKSSPVIIVDYLHSALRIGILFLNVIMFDIANILMGHGYMLLINQFVFVTHTFFIKFDQLTSLLDNKTQPFNRNYQTLFRFMYLHGRTLNHMNHIGEFISDLFTGYLLANVPLNLLLFITTFFLRNGELIEQKFLYIFCTLLIMQQFIGLFLMNLLCSIYTIKIHKCSKPLIYWFVHCKLPTIRLRLQTSNYIECMHNDKRHGLTMARTKIISMEFFIQVKFLN
ncbi:hypothetical protein BLA29_002906 [Euroglyphus maynei]|uniref:Uncharacterized protein n=1 Tax=Euroglyphus maynei TaxID=6958 RepID=A0A1Y3BRD6_EURMA|nr:hypothetical protein BLA29_002906 [Euroglyphus maynei]